MRGRAWCDLHRRLRNRPEHAIAKPGMAPRQGPLARPPTLVDEKALRRQLKDLAITHAPAAAERLVSLMTVGPPSSQVSAAKLVLGLAGIQTSPPQEHKHSPEMPSLPPGMDVAALLMVVKGKAVNSTASSMAHFSQPLALPEGAPSGSDDMSYLRKTPAGAEIIDVFAEPVGPEGGSSGAGPEVPEGQVP